MAEALFDKEVERMRLNSTMCLYDGKAVYVSTDDTEEGYVTVYHRAKEGKKAESSVIKITSPAFKYSDIRLGYVNNKGGVSYLSRRPERKFAAGLKAVVIDSSRGHVFSPRDDSLMSECVFDMLENKYPSLTEAIANVLSNKMKACAFHRWFALESTNKDKIVLLWKDKVCGFFNPIDNSVQWLNTPYMSLIRRTIERNSFNIH